MATAGLKSVHSYTNQKAASECRFLICKNVCTAKPHTPLFDNNAGGGETVKTEHPFDSCVEEDKKVVVFARFVPEIEAIKAMLEKKKLGYRLIYGATKDRAEQVKDFQGSR